MLVGVAGAGYGVVLLVDELAVEQKLLIRCTAVNGLVWNECALSKSGWQVGDRGRGRASCRRGLEIVGGGGRSAIVSSHRILKRGS